jgi:hypothetical protein
MRCQITTGCAEAAEAGKSKFKVVVLFVRADPEPVVFPASFASDGAIVAANLDCVNAAFFPKTQRRMPRISLEKSKVFVGELLNVPGKLMVASPERPQRVGQSRQRREIA